MSKIEHETIGQQVLDGLRKMILNLEFLPGEFLSLKALADMFGVSILPVREAVWQLEAEGILTVKPNKGIQLSQLTEKDFREIHLMRMALESIALSNACALRSKRDVKKAGQALEKLKKLAYKNNPRSYLKQNHLFHITLYEAADMPLLLSTIQNLRLRSHPYIYQNVTTTRPIDQTLKVHEDMYEGIAKQDADYAVHALQSDLNEAMDVLLNTWEKKSA